MPANGTPGKQQDAAHNSAAHTIAAEMLDLLVGKSPPQSQYLNTEQVLGLPVSSEDRHAL